jgi:hypothetical protein
MNSIPSGNNSSNTIAIEKKRKNYKRGQFSLIYAFVKL